MHSAELIFVAALGASLAACVGPVRSGAFTTETPPQENAMPPIPVDQGGPPISRERSPVLDQALSANSNAALIMFLLRNPGDPFAEQARTYLKARRTPDSAASVQSAAGADAAVVAAFDAARLAGTETAWAAFLARYALHPLAAEVPAFR